MSQFLEKIEKKYAVAKILVDKKQIWPILRVPFATSYLFKGKKIQRSETSKNLKNLFYGFRNWFRSYKYLIYSASGPSTRKLINGKYFGRFADPIADELGRDDTLIIEDPEGSYNPISKVYSNHIVSPYPIYFIAKIIKLLSGTEKIEGETILKDLKNEYNININEKQIINTFFSRYKIYKFIYKIFKPKHIFLICSYYDMARVKAAKDLGIPVTEIQHGSMGEGHEAYNIFAPLDKSYYPDHMLVFGKKDAEMFKTSNFIEPAEVYMIGSYYIDFCKSNPKIDDDFINKLSEKRIKIGVTLQSTVQDELISFIKKCSNLDENVIFILIPRKPVQMNYNDLELSSNTIFEFEKDFYELMSYVDYHVTVYSSCALEAPSLGVRNILVNINNLSRQYLGKILTEPKVSKYVETSEEFIWTIHNYGALGRDAISKLNEDVIKSGYANNLRNALRMIMNNPKSEQSN